MYKIHFINFGYDSHNEPQTIEEAKKVARQAGFQSIIKKDDEIIGSYCPLAGWKDYNYGN